MPRARARSMCRSCHAALHTCHTLLLSIQRPRIQTTCNSECTVQQRVQPATASTTCNSEYTVQPYGDGMGRKQSGRQAGVECGRDYTADRVPAPRMSAVSIVSSYLLHAACCTLPVARCTLPVACCTLPVACCTLHVARCPSHSVSAVSIAHVVLSLVRVRRRERARRCEPPALRVKPRCAMQQAPWNATCNMQCNTQQTTCSATCQLVRRGLGAVGCEGRVRERAGCGGVCGVCVGGGSGGP